MNNSVYEHAIELWSSAEFSTLQKELDTKIFEIKEKEAASLESRKELAKETKQFKKLETEERVHQINKIIKQYQNEVDSLTKRSKFSEQSLFEIYGKLSEAPDPIPLLRNSVEKLNKAEENKNLEDELTQLKNKLALYADYNSLKKRLTDLEESSAVTLAKRLTAKEKEINTIWEEKQKHWKDKENEFGKQIELLQENNKILENKINNGNITDDSNKGETKFTNTAEYTLLTHELETAQLRIFTLEKRNEDLTGSLAKLSNDAEREFVLESKDEKIRQLESENALLGASLERETAISKKYSSEFKEKNVDMEKEIESYKTEIEVIKRKLNTYSDYNQIKNELIALKKIEFGLDGDNESNDLSNNRNENTSTNVDNTLLSANRRLQTQLADLRVKINEANGKYNSQRKEVLELRQKVTKLTNMNSKLESDLEKIDNIDKFNDTSSMISTATRQINNRLANNGRLSPTSSILAIPEETEFVTGDTTNTILPIITKQRDRFRVRTNELEKQIREFNTEKSKLKLEINSLKNDNTKLYERVRYLSSYDIQNGTLHNKDLMKNNIDTEAQYSKSYEEQLHPLAKFKKHELAYYRKNSSMFEKMFLSLANIILQNKTSRMIFLFYCIGLHGLVFMMSMYVVNISGYLTPEVGIVHSSTGAGSAQANFGKPNLNV